MTDKEKLKPLVDHALEAWHASVSEVYEWLGWTEAEYLDWANGGEIPRAPKWFTRAPNSAPEGEGLVEAIKGIREVYKAHGIQEPQADHALWALEQAALRASDRDVREKATALADACDQLAEDSKAIFLFAQERFGPYEGKQIGEELAALREALKRSQT